MSQRKILAVAEAINQLTYPEMMELAGWFAERHVGYMSGSSVSVEDEIAPEADLRVNIRNKDAWASVFSEFARGQVARARDYAGDPMSGSY